MEFSIAIPQSPALKDIVRSFWQVDRDSSCHIRETIIPKGTVEVIFNLYDNTTLAATIGARSLRVPRCFVSGFNTMPIQVDIPYRQNFFGVYFHATALQKIFGVRVEEFANQCVDLALVDHSVNSLWHQLAEQKTFDGLVEIFSSWLLKRCPETTLHEKLFNDFLSSAFVTTTVTELADRLCYSPRHLSRKLRELTGMNVEKTLLYRKYLHSVNLIDRSLLSLTEIAHACDFSDQSHFSKTFKSFAGLNPAEYRVSKSQVSGHIFQHVR